jgi:hypothetical protein
MAGNFAGSIQSVCTTSIFSTQTPDSQSRSIAPDIHVLTNWRMIGRGSSFLIGLGSKFCDIPTQNCGVKDRAFEMQSSKRCKSALHSSKAPRYWSVPHPNPLPRGGGIGQQEVLRSHTRRGPKAGGCREDTGLPLTLTLSPGERGSQVAYLRFWARSINSVA